MNEIKKSKEFSYLYQTTFSNGDVYFHRFDATKSWSVEAFIQHQMACAKSDKRNDAFAKRVQTELNTVKVERIFFGTTEECIEKKRELISKSKSSVGSTRVNGIVNKSKDVYLQLKKALTKVVTSSNGEKLYFIESDYGMRLMLNDRMIGYKKHPLDSNYVLLNTNRVERI